MKATRSKSGITGITAAMGKLAQTRVLVGVPAKSTERGDGPINNATLLYIHENGAPAANIPARPSLVPGVRAVQGKVATHLKRAAGAALAGNAEATDQQLHAAGLIAENSVKALINAGIAPALADSTLRERASRGREGAAWELAWRKAGAPEGVDLAKPLIDTGKLRNSITHVVKRPGGSTKDDDQ
jgi:hypothetical protein